MACETSKTCRVNLGTSRCYSRVKDFGSVIKFRKELTKLPDTIIERAAKKSREFESQYGQRRIKCDGRPLAAIELKERNLIQEVWKIVNKLHSLDNTTARNMRCLVEVWHKVGSLSGSDCSHSKHSLVPSRFGGHPLHRKLHQGCK